MATKSDYVKIFFLRAVGNFLFLSALVGVALTFAPVAEAELVYRYNTFVGQTFYVATAADPCGEGANKPPPGAIVVNLAPQEPCKKVKKNSGFASLLKSEVAPLGIKPIDPAFDVIIPKIGANARVVPDVDPGKEEEYLEALKHGVAHAKGTVYPGEIGTTFLFAHSVGNFWEVSRWNAVFYLLRELQPGDEVDVFYKDKRYIYTVYDQKIVEPTDVGYLNIQSNFPQLTLQTCWPPGTTLKRLLVFARLQASAD